MTRGPAPKRSEERRRTNSPQPRKVGRETLANLGVDLNPEIPPPGEHWEQETVEWYESLRLSPGVIFMYASDWQAAWALLEQFDRALKPVFVGMAERWNSTADAMETIPVRERQPLNGAALNAIMNQLRNITLLGEEQRRKTNYEAPPLDTEPTRPAEDDGVVTNIEEARRRGLAG